MKQQLKSAWSEMIENERIFDVANAPVMERFKELGARVSELDNSWRQGGPHSQDLEDKYQAMLGPGTGLFSEFHELVIQRRDNRRRRKDVITKTPKRDTAAMLIIAEEGRDTSRREVNEVILLKIELLEKIESWFEDVQVYVGKHREVR